MGQQANNECEEEKVGGGKGGTANKMRRGKEIANGGHVDVKLIQGKTGDCQGTKSWKDKKGNRRLSW